MFAVVFAYQVTHWWSIRGSIGDPLVTYQVVYQVTYQVAYWVTYWVAYWVAWWLPHRTLSGSLFATIRPPSGHHRPTSIGQPVDNYVDALWITPV